MCFVPFHSLFSQALGSSSHLSTEVIELQCGHGSCNVLAKADVHFVQFPFIRVCSYVSNGCYQSVADPPQDTMTANEVTAMTGGVRVSLPFISYF